MINTNREQQNGRILGIDYGDKRIGIAISDNTSSIAFPLIVFESNNVFCKLFKIIDKYCVKLIVIGNPISLLGHSSGKQFEKVSKFADKLKSLRTNLEIVLWDERMSTHAAMRYINEAELSRAKQKKIKDKVAASFILQGFLDFKRFSSC